MKQNLTSMRQLQLLTILFFLIPVHVYANEQSDSLRRAITGGKTEVERMHAMTLLARELIPADLDSVRLLLEQSSKLAHADEHIVEQAAWLTLSGTYNWYAGNRDSAFVNYNKVYRMDDPEINNRRAASAINLASLHNQRGTPDSVIYYYQNAIELFTELGDEAGIAHAGYSIGVYYLRRDNYELALRNMLEALIYWEEAKDTFGLIHTHNVLGNIYLALDNNGKSLMHYETAAILSNKMPDQPAIANIYNNLVALFVNQLHDYDKAVLYADSAINIALQENNRPILYCIYKNIAVMYIKRGMYDEAKQWIRKADEYENDAAKNMITAARYYKAKMYRELDDLDKARMYYQEALEYAESMNLNKWAMLANRGLFAIDSLAGNYMDAISRLHEANRIRDTIFQKERVDRLAELQIIHETDIKEAENQMLREANKLKEEIIASQRRLMILSISASVLFGLLLLGLWMSRRKIKKQKIELEVLHGELLESQQKIRKKNKSLDKKNKQLVELNNTRNKFFSIISHDLRRPFTALLGLLNILVEDSGQFTEEEKKEVFSDLYKTSKNTYELLTNLLEWSAIQQKRIVNQPVKTPLKALADSCIDLLNLSIMNKEQQVINEIADDVQLTVDPKLLRSVLINLINNAIKFTPHGGTILINARPNKDGMSSGVMPMP